MTLLDAIIATGGLSRQADGNGAVILRQTDVGSQRVPVRLADLVRDGDSSANVPLQPGDIIVIPEGFLDGEWRVDYNAFASQTFSDNIDQGPDGEREAGFVTRAGPGISISGESARVRAAFNGDLAGVNQFGGDDEGFSLDPDIAGTSTTEIAEDVLFFDLSAALSRQLLDSRDSNSASGASTSNRDFVATVTASPYLLHRLGDFADAEWRYSISPVIVDSDDEGDVLSHDGSFILNSGSDFTQFGWTWTNRVGQEMREDESDIETASTDFGVTYPLPFWDGFALIGGIGYEYRAGDEDEDDNFDGLTWRGGFSYNPHPDFSLEATYGRRDDDENFGGSLSYQVGPKTSIFASYSEALESSQQRAISNLGRLTIDPVTGELVDENGEPFDDDDPFAFDDGTTRTKTLRVGASHRSGRNSFNLTGSGGTSEGGNQGNEEFYEARFSWSRSLSTDLNLSSSASYEWNDYQDDDRTDNTYGINLGLSYRLAADVRTFLNYNFETQDSTEDDENYYENAVTLGVNFSF
jgi:uncharacterized protein (PEP-CTERM system associated)